MLFYSIGNNVFLIPGMMIDKNAVAGNLAEVIRDIQ